MKILSLSNIRSQILAGYMFVLALLITISAVLLFTFQGLVDDFDDLVNRNQPILQNISLLERLMVDMETGVRGFLITGNDEFLEPYDNARERFDVVDAQLHDLVLSDEQETRLNEIQRLSEEWLVVADELITLRREVDLSGMTDTAVAANFSAVNELGQLNQSLDIVDEMLGAELDNEVPNDTKITYLYGLSNNIYDMQSSLNGYLVSADETLLAEYNSTQATFNDNRDALSRISSIGERAQIDQIDTLVQQWMTDPVVVGVATNATTGINENSFGTLIERVNRGDGKILFDQMRSVFAEFTQTQLDINEATYTNVTDNVSAVTLFVISVTAVGAFFAVVIGLYISSRISGNVSKLNKAAQEFANGKLNQQVDINTRDEIGALAQSFNRMATDIRTMVNAERDRKAILEQTVTDYLSFVERVTSGDLAARLDLDGRGEDSEIDQELNQLAFNLNEMAGNLDGMVYREKEAREILERTVTEYRNFIQRVSDGDLTAQLELSDQGDTEDDLYQLGVNLNAMVINLREMANQVREAATSVSSAATQIQASTTQQTASATEQDAAVTQTVATVEEVRATVMQTSERAQAVADASQQSVEVSRNGQQSVTDTVTGMDLIRERVSSIAENILLLSERTQQIGEIIETVNALAEQSKLLALNASIEAARAGEEGKGFAVVAMEVRQLAEQSREATGRVRNILNEIQQATNTAVMVTEEGSKGAESGMSMAQNAGEAIRELAATIEEAAQAAIQIAASTHQQANGMDQLAAAMTQIKQATAQTAASARQTEQSVHDLSDMAQQLEIAAARYEL